jgi:hypothetical protein
MFFERDGNHINHNGFDRYLKEGFPTLKPALGTPHSGDGGACRGQAIGEIRTSATGRFYKGGALAACDPSGADGIELPSSYVFGTPFRSKSL